MVNEIVNARVRNFPYHRKKTVKTANGQKTTNQTFMPGEEVKVTQAEYIASIHLLETEEEYQARQPKTSKAKTTGEK